MFACSWKTISLEVGCFLVWFYLLAMGKQGDGFDSYLGSNQLLQASLHVFIEDL